MSSTAQLEQSLSSENIESCTPIPLGDAQAQWAKFIVLSILVTFLKVGESGDGENHVIQNEFNLLSKTQSTVLV